MAEKTINGRDFMVGAMLAKDAVVLQARLMKMIGAGVDRLPEILKGAGANASEEDKEKSRAAAVAAFTDIFSNSDPQEMADLLQHIVEIATIKRGKSSNYEQVVMDLDFSSASGDPSSLYPVAIFVLQEVLGDFFTGLRVSGNQVKIPTA